MYKGRGGNPWQKQQQQQQSYSGSSVGSAAEYDEHKGDASEVRSHPVESGPEVVYDNTPAPIDPTTFPMPISQIDGETLAEEVREAFKLMELLGKAQKNEDLSFMKILEKFTFEMQGYGDPEDD